MGCIKEEDGEEMKDQQIKIVDIGGHQVGSCEIGGHQVGS